MTDRVVKALGIVSCPALGLLPADSSLALHSLLKEARQLVVSDHKHKVEALELDRQCMSFNPTSGNISFKVNPTRIPYG